MPSSAVCYFIFESPLSPTKGSFYLRKASFIFEALLGKACLQDTMQSRADTVANDIGSIVAACSMRSLIPTEKLQTKVASKAPWEDLLRHENAYKQVGTPRSCLPLP
jgi:hypothetical protein